MINEVITEIVNFDVDKDLKSEHVVEIVHQLEEKFHMKQDGYIDSELIKANENSWTLIMHWSSMQELRGASKKMMTDPKTEEFRKVVIPPSVKIFISKQIKRWNKQA